MPGRAPARRYRRCGADDGPPAAGLLCGETALQPTEVTYVKVVIADDEPLARERLRALLGEHAGAEVVAEDGHGLGRELFAGMRRNALAAEQGACTWL